MVFFSVPCLFGYGNELSINLNKSDIYFKQGFSRAWTKGYPPEGDEWQKIDGNPAGSRSVRIIDLEFQGKPVRRPFSLREYPPRDFTLLTQFIIPTEIAIEDLFPGLFLPQIAENWEIYLNGYAIHSAMHLSKDGEITLHRGERDVLVYLNPRLIRKGENVLAFRIYGDPTLFDTGFARNSPILIEDYPALERKKIKIVSLVLLSIYLLVGLYHISLFFIRRSERYNILFGFFSITLSIYLLCRTSMVYNFIRDTDIAVLVEFVSLYMLFPLILLFMELIIIGRIRIFTRIYTIFCALLIVASLPTTLSFRIDILRIWQYSSIVPLVYYIVFQLGIPFSREVMKIRESPVDDRQPGIVPSIAEVMKRTVTGNLMVGALILASCAVFDVLNALFFNLGFVTANYGFFIFIIGVTRVLSNRFRGLYSEIDGLHVDLDRKSKDLSETRVQYGLSREKFRLLVENSQDIIFSLDEKFRFIASNRAIDDMLGISLDQVRSKTLFDLIHDEAGTRSVTFQFVQEKLDRFVQEKKPIHIKLDFKNSFGIEPVTMQVRLEYIQIGGKNEIFGRASRITDDILNRFLLAERHSYRIGNLLLVADDLSHRITRNLVRYTGRSEHSLLRLAVREIIINAIEHGNLDITFDEKTRETGADSYFEYLSDRQNDPRFRERSVTVEYEMDENRVIYVVADQGSGFDYSKYLRDDSLPNDTFLAHGRGIALARGIFDEIKYDNGGSRVVLVKYFNGRSTQDKIAE